MLAEIFLRTVAVLVLIAALCIALCWSRRSVPRSKRLDKRQPARRKKPTNPKNERKDHHV